MFGNLNKKQALKIVLGIFCILNFGFGFYWVYIIFTGGLDSFSILIGIFLPQILAYQIIVFLATTILFLKLIHKEKRKKIYYVVAITGLSLTIVMSLPIIVIPISISNAESEFNAAFGVNWENQIPEDVKNNYFLSSPLPLDQPFLGGQIIICGEPAIKISVLRSVRTRENKSFD